jgi:hypothetical protein
MTSDAQTSGNRRNAKRSSGPLSESGKARSRMNGWHCCVEPSRGDFGVGHRTWRLARDPISPPLALLRWLRRAPYVDRVGREDHARSLNAAVPLGPGVGETDAAAGARPERWPVLARPPAGSEQSWSGVVHDEELLAGHGRGDLVVAPPPALGVTPGRCRVGWSPHLNPVTVLSRRPRRATSYDLVTSPFTRRII